MTAPQIRDWLSFLGPLLLVRARRGEAIFQNGYLQVSPRGQDAPMEAYTLGWVPPTETSLEAEAQRQRVTETFLVSTRGWAEIVLAAEAARDAAAAGRKPRKGRADRLNDLKARAAMFSAPETPVTATETANALGLAEGTFGDRRPDSVQRLGHRWLAPFADWLPLIPKEDSNAPKPHHNPTAAHRPGNRDRQGGKADPQGSAGLLHPGRREGVLAGPQEGHPGDGVDRLGDAKRSQRRPRRNGRKRPDKLSPLGGPDQERG